MIVDDAKVFNYIEPRLFGSMVVPLRATHELNDQQIEFLMASAVAGYPWNLLTGKYSLVMIFSLLGIGLLLQLLWLKELQPLYLGLLAILSMLFLIICIKVSANMNKGKYAQILSVTKDCESANTALIAQSKLSLASMNTKTIEILRSSHTRMGVPEDKLESSISGSDLEVYKLHKAAEEIGLVEHFPE